MDRLRDESRLVGVDEKAGQAPVLQLRVGLGEDQRDVATLPSEIHIFDPFSSQPPSTFVARVRWLAASEPASGSVRPKQPSHSPEQSLGR